MNVQILGNSVIYCPEFISGVCKAKRDGAGHRCPFGKEGVCNLVASENVYGNMCGAVVLLVAQYLARNEWEDTAIGGIIETVARMDARYNDAPALVKEEMERIVDDYFEAFREL